MCRKTPSENHDELRPFNPVLKHQSATLVCNFEEIDGRSNPDLALHCFRQPPTFL